MKRDEIVTGLKEGKRLIMDGWAHENERHIILDLQEEGLVDITPIHSDRESQYTAFAITWKNNKTQSA